MMLGAPLILTFLLGSAFGGAGGFTVPVTEVVVVDLDTLAAGNGGGGRPQPTQATGGRRRRRARVRPWSRP